MTNDNHHIFIIDDEQKVCNVLCETLMQNEINATGFTREKECLKELQSQRCDLLITDLKMPEINGIELMKKAKYIIPYLPVMIITGYGDVPTAISAIKSGAVDFIEKPLEIDKFIKKVKSVLHQNNKVDKIINKPLTNTETRVLRLLINGYINRKTANIMKRSIRTIEVHRSNIMKKLNADNVIELMKKAALLGIVELKK